MQSSSSVSLAVGVGGIKKSSWFAVKSVGSNTTLSDPCSVMAAPKWAQKTITLPPHNRGCHLITPKVPTPSKIAFTYIHVFLGLMFST
ncbi:hypothetical protein HanPI659440_Chr14g0525031 [Helianthus annuus]|nr:hypothetical protein HanPI659440_Chr14g0525031 [Helianthus annuus]